MVVCFREGNKKMATMFAKRALEFNPSAAAAGRAQAVIAEGEKNPPTDTVPVRYDDKNPFTLCANSMMPIYRGSPTIRCPYCFASFDPQFQGSLCTVCGLAEVGRETPGVVWYNK